MEQEYFYLVVIPVINGLVEVAKRAGLNNRYCPIVAIVLGLMAGIGLRDPAQNIAIGILEGLILGLSAVGMYSGARNVLQTKKNGNNGN
ncbi:MAG: hypothetical protein ACM3MK_02510 [Chitinophagales bacterium]